MSASARKLAPVGVLLAGVALFWWSGRRPVTEAGVAVATTDSEFEAGLRKALASAEGPFKKADRNESLAPADLAALEKAVTQFAALHDFRPREPGTFFGTGKALALLGRHADAEPMLRQAIYNGDAMLKDGGRDPLALRIILADARYERSRVLLALSRNEEALVDAEAAANAFPTNANFQTGRGSVLLQLKRYADAIAAFQTALVADPNHRVARKLMEMAERQLGG